MKTFGVHRYIAGQFKDQIDWLAVLIRASAMYADSNRYCMSKLIQLLHRVFRLSASIVVANSIQGGSPKTPPSLHAPLFLIITLKSSLSPHISSPFLFSIHTPSVERRPIHYSPITYSHPFPPIQTSCNLPTGTSILAPTPKVSLLGFSSRGYVMVRVPRRTRWVVRPLWEWGG
jgi:hypothetical protein